jgi:uncharacterized membrane protein YqiK
MKGARDEDNKGHVVLGLSELKEIMREAIRETRHAALASEIALRLANVEAILMKLLQHGAKRRAGTKRTKSMRARIKNEALAHSERPQERHYRMVRELMSRR